MAYCYDDIRSRVVLEVKANRVDENLGYFF